MRFWSHCQEWKDQTNPHKCTVLRARRNEKKIQETKICYLESQQKALLKFNKIY